MWILEPRSVSTEMVTPRGSNVITFISQPNFLITIKVIIRSPITIVVSESYQLVTEIY